MSVRRAREVLIFVCCGEGDSRRLLMLLRSRADGGFWHCIAGALELDESDEEAAARELWEETGFDSTTLSAKRFEYSYPMEEVLEQHRLHYATGTEQIEVACFLADLGGPLRPSLNAEHDAYRWCTLDEAEKLFKWPTVAVALRETLREEVVHG